MVNIPCSIITDICYSSKQAWNEGACSKQGRNDRYWYIKPEFHLVKRKAYGSTSGCRCSRHLQCRMLFLLLTHILAVSIGVNPDPWNQKNDIPGMETTPWWFSTALMLFLIATMIVLFHYTFPQMIRRPWDFVEEVAVCSIDLAVVRFLLKIADGDPLFELILTLVSLVPLMGFCWIWHKLERLRQCWFDATGPKSDWVSIFLGWIYFLAVVWWW